MRLGMHSLGLRANNRTKNRKNKLFQCSKNIILSAFPCLNRPKPLYCRQFRLRIAHNRCTVGISSSRSPKTAALSAFPASDRQKPLYCQHFRLHITQNTGLYCRQFRLRTAQNHCTVGISGIGSFKTVVLSAFSASDRQNDVLSAFFKFVTNP